MADYIRMGLEWVLANHDQVRAFVYGGFAGGSFVFVLGYKVGIGVSQRKISRLEHDLRFWHYTLDRLGSLIGFKKIHEVQAELREEMGLPNRIVFDDD